MQHKKKRSTYYWHFSCPASKPLKAYCAQRNENRVIPEKEQAAGPGALTIQFLHPCNLQII